MILNTNIGLSISHQLQETSRSISRSLERLSTGKRINSPRDDVAGFSTLTTLTSQIRGLFQANLNINQAKGLVQTADAGISSQLDIVQRMREIAVQASNSTLGSSEREALNNELSSLMDEFRRITSDTEFNGTKLLDGSFGTKEFQIGANYGQELSFEISSLKASDTFLKTIGSGSFQSASTLAIGDAPTDMALADLNGDGALDMITIENGPDDLAIRLGNGDGTFGAARTFDTGGTPNAVRVGDMNGDGIKDIVVSGGNSDFEVFIGRGDGTFDSRVTYAAAATEFELVDINNDGALDIVGATSTANIAILLNNGDGTFQAQSTIGTSTTVNRIKSADFDNDGNMDLIVTTAASGTAQVLRGNGSGGFSGLSTFATGGTAANTAVGDFNNDGKMDFIVGAGNSTSVYVRLGVGDGTFTSASNFTAAGIVNDIALGDFNGDGNLDFVGLATAAADYLISYGNGQGGFTQGSTGDVSATAITIMAGDLNGDGVDDFASLTSAATDVVSIHLQNTQSSSAEADVSVSSVEKAQKLIGILDDTIDRLVEERSNLGISLTRLENIQAYNLTQSEELATAKSSIEEADIAYETSELVRNQILQQAQIASLSQANLNMQVVLGLLQF